METAKTGKDRMIEEAKRFGVAANKFWSKDKLISKISKAKAERRHDTQKRAWASRRAIHGDNGLRAAAKA